MNRLSSMALQADHEADIEQITPYGYNGAGDGKEQTARADAFSLAFKELEEALR